MRFWLAVLAAAVAQAYAFTILTGAPGASLPALVMMLLGALGAGFFAARRGALAGFLSVYLGALIYAVASYLTASPIADTDAPRTVLDLIGWTLRLGWAIVPFAIAAAIAGWLGAQLRRRLLRAR